MIKRIDFCLVDPDSTYLKSWDVKGDSGKNNKQFFCGQCGCSLYTQLEIMPEATYIKAGGHDGGVASLNGHVGTELYCKDRVQYLEASMGTKQECALG